MHSAYETDGPDAMRGRPLSERERQVLRLRIRFAQYRLIGAALGISVHTVKHHLQSAREKLGARDTTHAVVLSRVWEI